MSERKQFNWRLPVWVAIAACITLLALFLWGADADLLYILLLGPLVCLTFLVLLIIAAFRKRPSQAVSVFLSLVLFLGTSVALIKNAVAIRPWFRWLLWSRHYKAQLLEQPAPVHGELRHIVWDGWGGTPGGDWAAYVVFDPTDSLSVTARYRLPGKLKGIPCDVDAVRRLERDWYSVTLSMSEWWDRCG